MEKFIKYVLSLLHPHKCTFCRRAIAYNNYTFICPSCEGTIPYIKGATCFRCGSPRHEGSMPVCNVCRKYSHAFSGSFTPLLYKDSARKAILGMKFHEKESFCHSFAYLITKNLLEKGFPDIDFITYIPISKERFAERGYNQSELIATECGKILNLPVTEALNRVDGTPRQSSLPLNERRKNVKKSFTAKDIKLKGTALLIDDVYTTGSTMSYCSSLLLNMGCSKVYIACVALNSKFD